MIGRSPPSFLNSVVKCLRSERDPVNHLGGDTALEDANGSQECDPFGADMADAFKRYPADSSGIESCSAIILQLNFRQSLAENERVADGER